MGQGQFPRAPSSSRNLHDPVKLLNCNLACAQLNTIVTAKPQWFLALPHSVPFLARRNGGQLEDHGNNLVRSVKVVYIQQAVLHGILHPKAYLTAIDFFKNKYLISAKEGCLAL